MRLLTVPIRLDALWLATDRDVTGPAASFTRLPHVDAVTGHDVGADQPYLSEAILPPPLQTGLRLRAGIHLHWSLPDALTRLVHGATGPDVPRVPDRWLVTRTGANGIEGRWVVDSDALSDIDRGAVTYPVMTGDPTGATGRPWRYLGRTLPLSVWPGQPVDRVAALTALGYGEPTFAAFYPNSHSVFGYHDDDFAASAPVAGTRYDVVGWYADSAADELLEVLAERGTRTWQEALADELDWAVTGDGAAPDRIVCFGQLLFSDVAPTDARPGPGPGTESGVWIANTATEALAAHLGAELPGVDERQMEDLLEALTVADELESGSVDLPTRLAQARHTGSFGTVAAPTEWTVRRQDDPASADPAHPLTAEQRQQREGLPLPAGFGDLLVALNDAQAAYDRETATADGLRGRLFADWHRYLTCAYPPEHGRSDYPDPDLVAAFLRHGVARLTALLTRIGTWPPTGAGTSLAHRLAAARQAAEQALATENAAIATARTRFELQSVPGPSYYTPNEPVVLLTGTAATPSDRHGQDGAGLPGGLLSCAVLDLAGLTAGDLSGATGVALLGDRVAALATKLTAADPTHPALRVWTGQPWHPLLLQWEVEFFPARAGNNLDPSGRDFDPDFIGLNYELSEVDRELTPRGGRELVDAAANVYVGSTVLSAAARPLLSGRILRYLRGGPLARCNVQRSAAGQPILTAEQLDVDATPLLAWCAAQTEDPRLATLASAYAHLAVNEDSNLAQSLGGFNDALVMLRTVRQLPIVDPLGFAGGQALAALVDAAVTGQARHAPVPFSDFNPIRAGILRLRQLRIVDTFGIGHDVDVSTLRTTSGLRSTNRPNAVALPPRLAVPARVRLDLLDAERPDRPVTGLAESSPVCGWLLPDPLDDGLRVYAAGGELLGTLYLAADPARPEVARWQTAPDGPTGTVDLIGDPGLRAVVVRLRNLGAQGLADFVSGLEDALDAVEPENPALHTGRANLPGRPVAVVRLSIDLEASGPPAIHQDWNVFRQDLGRTTRETNAYPLVRFPVRLGEHGRLGDGTLGYWLESDDGGLGPHYHDVTAEAGDPALTIGIDLRPRRVTALLEPAGAIHASTGILPTVAVRLDAAHHQDALARLETGFLAAPVLTDADTIAMLLPAAGPDRVWSWRERDSTDWVEVTDPPAPADAFPVGLTAREGWLTLHEQPT